MTVCQGRGGKEDSLFYKLMMQSSNVWERDGDNTRNCHIAIDIVVAIKYVTMEFEQRMCVNAWELG